MSDKNKPGGQDRGSTPTVERPVRDIEKSDRPLSGRLDPINRLDPPKPWPGKPGKK